MNVVGVVGMEVELVGKDLVENKKKENKRESVEEKMVRYGEYVLKNVVEKCGLDLEEVRRGLDLVDMLKNVNGKKVVKEKVVKENVFELSSHISTHDQSYDSQDHNRPKIRDQ